MENCVCLSHGVQVAGATRQVVMRIVAGVGDLVQRIRDDEAQVGYSVAGRSGGRVTSVRSAPCTWRRGVRVSWLSLKTKIEFLG
jgi:hypothetical protein